MPLFLFPKYKEKYFYELKAVFDRAMVVIDKKLFFEEVWLIHDYNNKQPKSLVQILIG